MKLPLLADLNAIGLRGAADRALLAAHWLKVATVSSPAVTITPAVPAIVAKPEIIAQTAKPARAATTAVPANPSNPARPFGSLFLNSPAFAAGAALPAFPPKLASAAVIGVPAVVGVPAVPAVTSPKIDALKGWEDAIEINKTASNIEIIAYLPCASSPLLIGASTNHLPGINEMTTSTLIPGKWLGERSSVTLGTETLLPPTVEQYLYKQAQLLVAESGSTSTIENSTKLVNGLTVPCKKLTLQLAASNYDLEAEDLQLGKVGLAGLTNLSIGTVIGDDELIFNDTIYSALIFEDSSQTLPMKIVIPGNRLIPGVVFQGFVPARNQDYSSDTAWLAFVDTTPQGSMEREFTNYVQAIVPDGYTFPPICFTRATTTAPDSNTQRTGGKYVDSTGDYWEYYRKGYGAPED